MIFNMAGGGAALNYKVVGGTTEPETPRENTIWVNTGTPISVHIFSATEPPETVAGMVWITVGTASTGAFNALKKNSIQIYPLYANQYVNGAWVAVSAKIYKNGAWVEWTTEITLYSNGSMVVPLTLSSVTKEATYLKVTLAKNGNATIASDPVTLNCHKTVSVTYSNLTGDGTFDGGLRVRVKDSSDTIVKSTARSTAVSGTIELDISDLNLVGDYVIEVYANNSSGSYAGSCRVSSIKVLV